MDNITIFGETIGIDEFPAQLPVGQHEVIINSTFITNNNSIAIEYLNNEGAISDYFNISSGSDKAIAFNKIKLARLCKAVGIKQLDNIIQFKGCSLKITVGEQTYNDKKSLVVTKVESIF